MGCLSETLKKIYLKVLVREKLVMIYQEMETLPLKCGADWKHMQPGTLARIAI